MLLLKRQKSDQSTTKVEAVPSTKKEESEPDIHPVQDIRSASEASSVACERYQSGSKQFLYNSPDSKITILNSEMP